jgi:uncharacterized protein involved in response to NO
VLRAPAVVAAAHPLWQCGLRPFFLFAALSATGLMALWGAFLGLGLPVPAVAGGHVVWHAHELLFGFGLAAVAGFTLTAIPEFTRSPDFAPRPVRLFAGLWLAGRAAFWSSAWLGAPALVLSALAHLGLVVGLAAMLAPRLLTDPGRRHLSFLWTLAALAAAIAGFYVDALVGAHPAPVRWLRAALGVLMILIVVAMSRISTRIVNRAIDEMDPEGRRGIEYRAPAPKRNLAIICIALYTAAEFLAAGARIGGWLALAAAAAVFNMQGDWHVGRALLRRWVLMLYGVYVLMACGYGLMGIALVAGLGPDGVSAGRHLLAAGALGLAVYAVLNIAGRIHCGLPLDERPWVPAGAALLVAAAAARAAAALLGSPADALMVSASLCWVLPFGFYAWRMGPVLVGPRRDGGKGCEGIVGRSGR